MAGRAAQRTTGRRGVVSGVAAEADQELGLRPLAASSECATSRRLICIRASGVNSVPAVTKESSATTLI